MTSVEKKSVGRPRKNIIVPDGINRKSKVNVEYLKNRYKTDPEFNQKCKERAHMYYERRKQKLLSLEEREEQKNI